MSIISFLRQYRVGQFAVFDFATAYIGLYLLAPLITRAFGLIRMRMTASHIMLLALPLSVVVHLLIGTRTPLVKMVLDPSGHLVAKLIILIMVILGLRGIVW